MQSISEKLGLGEGDRKLSPRAWIALMAIALAAMLPGFFNIPTMDRDEARYSQASRQMMETGDYIDIRFQDQVRHVKPVGIYWMQVVTTAPFGGEEAPQWAHRLPSLIGCLVAVGLTAWFGARVGGSRVGFAAGIILAVGVLMSVEARTAKTDAMLLAAITLAQVALYFLFHPPDEKKTGFFGWPLVFWLAHGAGLLIKGPIVTLVSAATLIPLCLWRRDWSIVKRLHLPVGIIVMLAVVLPWVVTITIQTNGGFIEESIGHALMGKVAKGDDSHGAPPGYHTLALLLTWWPMLMLLPLAAVYGWQNRRAPLVQYLIAWIIPTWLIFELVATKLPHYTLPVFPALAVLSALAMLEAPKLLAGAKLLRAAHWLFLGLFLVVAGLFAYVPTYLGSEVGTDAPAISVALIGAVLLISAAAVWFSLKPDTGRLLLLTGGAALFYVAIYQLTMPAFDRFWLTRSLDRQVAELSGCDNVPLATLGYREPSVVFTFGTTTLLAGNTADAVGHLEQYPACGLVAVTAGEREQFTVLAQGQGLELRALAVVEGFNYVKGDALELTLFVLDSSPWQAPAADRT